MLNVDAESSEKVFNLVQEVEKRGTGSFFIEKEQDRSKAFERLMQYPRKKVPPDFNYKKELLEAVDERFNRTH